jgi:hypothetical protein
MMGIRIHVGIVMHDGNISEFLERNSIEESQWPRVGFVVWHSLRDETAQ